MIQAIFKFLLDAVGTTIQLIMIPINVPIVLALPDLSDKILEVSNTFSTVFDPIAWALGLIPDTIIGTLIFILSIEIAKHTIFTSTHVLIKVWNIFQKIKFW